VKNIFIQEEIHEIKSMGEYWKEVAQRGNGKAILQSELNNLFTFIANLEGAYCDYRLNKKP
jgi:hypothetical protein